MVTLNEAVRHALAARDAMAARPAGASRGRLLRAAAEQRDPRADPSARRPERADHASVGTVVARWGDTRQVDFTFSVAKSYLSLLAGIAVVDGLIAELDEPVARHGG